MASILTYLHREVGASAADKVERRLFVAFHGLALGRIIGHRRADLTSKAVLFLSVPPYQIVYRSSKSAINVVRVVHGSRDLNKLL